MRHRARKHGFTLVELVMVIVMMAALATVALPRMTDADLWRLRAYGDDLTSQVQRARRLALAQRRPLTATLQASGLTVTDALGRTVLSAPCPSAVPQCLTETGSRSVTFNAGNSGATTTSTGTTLVIGITDGRQVAWRYAIELETGWIHPVP